MTSALIFSYPSTVKGTFTLPHAILSWTSGVSTMKRSCGERPVYAPVMTRRLPVSVRVPSPRSSAFSTSAAVEPSMTVLSSVWLMPYFASSSITIGPPKDEHGLFTYDILNLLPPS